jgi:hypothetical protein
MGLIETFSAENSAKALTLKAIGCQCKLIKQSSSTIVKYLQIASKHNYPLALYQMGLLMLTTKQFGEAYRYMILAAERT